MPKLVSKKEGAGNGKKTRLANIEDVAKSLKVPPEFPTKWFGLELGAQSTYAPNDAIVNGWHETPDLVPLLDKYIETYVLCQKCHLPEIKAKMKVQSKKVSFMTAKCQACGWKGALDSTH